MKKTLIIIGIYAALISTSAFSSISAKNINILNKEKS
jgi:hypothetical protein